MAKLSVNAIRDLARQIVAANPGGIRYTTLVNEILERNPETKKNTIEGSVLNQFAERLKLHDAEIFQKLFC